MRLVLAAALAVCCAAPALAAPEDRLPEDLFYKDFKKIRK
jgi:hypothetical protein